MSRTKKKKGNGGCMYYIIKSEWNRHEKKMNRDVVFATDDKMEAAEYDSNLRKQLRKIDKDGALVDCYIKNTDEKIDASLYNSLTEEEKKDIIEIDGHRYIRKMWETLHNAEKKAMEAAIEAAGENCTEEYLQSNIESGYITIHKARNGRDVAWYLDMDGHEGAVYVDNLQVLGESEREMELY